MSETQLQASAAAPRVIGHRTHGTYETARGVAGLFAFFGWVIVIGGVLVFLIGSGAGAPPVLAFGAGVVVAAVGLLLVAAQQMLRAAVDSADYARQSLLLQVGLAEGRIEIDLTQPLLQQASKAASVLSPTPLPSVEAEFEHKGRRIVKRGRDYFINGHDQPYASLDVARLIIDRGDV